MKYSKCFVLLGFLLGCNQHPTPVKWNDSVFGSIPYNDKDSKNTVFSTVDDHGFQYETDWYFSTRINNGNIITYMDNMNSLEFTPVKLPYDSIHHCGNGATCYTNWSCERTTVFAIITTNSYSGGFVCGRSDADAKTYSSFTLEVGCSANRPDQQRNTMRLSLSDSDPISHTALSKYEVEFVAYCRTYRK